MATYPTRPPEPSVSEESDDAAILRAHGLEPAAFSHVLAAHVVGHLLAGRVPEPAGDLPPALEPGARVVAKGEPLTILEVTPHFALLAGPTLEFALPTRDLVAAIKRASSAPPASTPSPDAPRLAGFPRGSLWRR
jgi:hypothetical protein